MNLSEIRTNPALSKMYKSQALKALESGNYKHPALSVIGELGPTHQDRELQIEAFYTCSPVLEQAEPLGRSPVEIILLDAMASAVENKGDILEVFGINPKTSPITVDVVLTVNGVQVPFHEAMSSALLRWQSTFDERVKAKALELVDGSGLGDLYTEIQDAEWRIREALEKISDDGGMKLGEFAPVLVGKGKSLLAQSTRPASVGAKPSPAPKNYEDTE